MDTIPAADTSGLLETLQTLERELHHPGVRCSAERLAALLHPDFHEVGRSGRAYTLETVTRFLLSDHEPPDVVPDDFRVALLGDGQALLTYRSAHRQPDGSLAHHTLRSSVWVRTAVGWQLRYHQGTPAADPWSVAS